MEKLGCLYYKQSFRFICEVPRKCLGKEKGHAWESCRLRPLSMVLAVLTLSFYITIITVCERHRHVRTHTLQTPKGKTSMKAASSLSAAFRQMLIIVLGFLLLSCQRCDWTLFPLYPIHFPGLLSCLQQPSYFIKERLYEIEKNKMDVTSTSLY